MPAALASPVLGAGVSALGGIGGAIVGSKANKKASDASLQAQREALAYEREKEAARKAEYDQAMALYKQQLEAYNAQRAGILRRYGVNVPGGGAGVMGSPPTKSPALTLGTLAGRQVPPPMVPNAAPSLEGWENWGNYAATE